MNRIDKDHRHELYSDVPDSVDHLAYCKKHLYVLFSGTMMLFKPLLLYLAWLRVVYVCVAVWVGVFHLWVFKFRVVIVLWQYFHLRNCECSAVQWSPGNIIFTGCRRRNCVGRCLVNLANVSQSCQQNLPGLKRFDSLPIYCGKAYSIHDI